VRSSNNYVLTFAVIITVVAAVLLAGAATLLKPMQDANRKKEKQENILSVVGKTGENDYKQFDQFITSLVIDENGDVVEGVKAFDIDLTIDKRIKSKDANHKLQYPLYVFEENGKKTYILQLAGVGLWGPIWGYLALDEDGNTIRQAVFDHKGETPGLGAEINTDAFESQFQNKLILNENNEFVSVQVTKGAKAEGEMHQVDAISGGTITSNGVSNMLKEDIQFYLTYLNKSQS
jgi:Na+-transporting NADH:ubiquinone oxidoreductase subunit C